MEINGKLPWRCFRCCLILCNTLLLLLAGFQAAAQSEVLKGRITDENGNGIAYAAVQVAGSGTTTDADGDFTIQLNPGKYLLKISSVGYQYKVISVTIPAASALTVELSEDISELDEVVITATRTSRSMDNVPVPVSVVGAEEIRQIGSLRLDDVLREQTGLQVVSDHGTGLQIQGLGSDYILVLIDGEPVIGRTAGTLDLSRLAVDNIERVEIIKGPSSSLYGSEAMAGVVNIITKKNSTGFEGSLRARTRSFGTSDLSVSGGYADSKFSASVFADRLHTNGYDLTPETVSMTAPAFTAYTINPKLSWKISESLKFSLNTRFYTEDQENVSDVIIEDESVRINENGFRRDWNIMPTLEYNLGDQHKFQLRNYTTGYETETSLTYQSDGTLYDESYFDQLFNRTELQYDWYLNDRNIITAGAGHTIETVEATRYQDVNAFRANYGFAQYQWSPAEKFNIIIGGRFDTHSEYASRFSPKIAAGYSLSKWLKVQASFGGGFKAPDFRQLLLDFTNPVAGYSVLGAVVAEERMAQLEAEGQIDMIFIDPSAIGSLEAETSLSWNAGFHFTGSQKFSGNINFFRNEVSNLIDTAPIARKTNGQNVFSYFNFDEVVTQGAELNASYNLLENLTFSLGYQFLDSRDLEAVEAIENGEVYRRDPSTNNTVRVSMADYGGLPNRSRHSGNAKLNYTNRPFRFDIALRGIYRGRWGVGDANGNGVIDVENEYADGYMVFNLGLNKRFLDWLNVEAGVNNIFDTLNENEPSLSGRIWYGGVSINFNNRNN